MHNDAGLYFIASTVYHNSFTNYPTTLYKLKKKGQLKRLQGITTQNQGTLFVRPYYDNQQVIVASVNNDEYLQLDIIDMHNPHKENSAELKICDGCSYMNGHFLAKIKMLVLF